MRKKILITGVSGFLGNSLAKRMLRDNFEVIGIDTGMCKISHDNFTFIQGSAANLALMTHSSIGVDAIFHLAARVPLAERDRDFYESNVLAAGVAANVCRVNNIKSLLLVSSSAVYGYGKGFEFSEDDPTLPFERYGKSKLEGERLAERELGGSTKLVILRPRTILGPGRLGIFSTLFAWINEGIFIPVLGPGMGGLQFIGVDDLVEAIILTEERGEGVYNVGASMYNSTLKELKDLTLTLNSRSKVFTLPEIFVKLMLLGYYVRLSPFTPWHIIGYSKSVTVNCNRLKELGWVAKESTGSILLSNYLWSLNDNVIPEKYSENSPHKNSLQTPTLKLVSLLARVFTKK